MKTRERSEHVLRTGADGLCARAFVHLTNTGAVHASKGGMPPVRVTAEHTGTGSFVDGQLTLEAAELLRRALNDVLGPIHEAREKQDARDFELQKARASAGGWNG